MTVLDLDHVQVACPPGAAAEQAMRTWYLALGMAELPKPAALAVRGGFWLAAGPRQVHIGVEEGFRPARKAHPCFVVDDIDDLAARLQESGSPVRWSQEIPEVRRFHTEDPVGNRVEIQAAPPA